MHIVPAFQQRVDQLDCRVVHQGKVQAVVLLDTAVDFGAVRLHLERVHGASNRPMRDGNLRRWKAVRITLVQRRGLCSNQRFD